MSSFKSRAIYTVASLILILGIMVSIIRDRVLSKSVDAVEEEISSASFAQQEEPSKDIESESISDTALFMINSDRCKGDPKSAPSEVGKIMLSRQIERIFNDLGGKRHEKEAMLLLMCQETKYRSNLISPAKAYGLTQMIMATAQNEANRHGLGKISPEDLFNPEISLYLGYSHFLYLLSLPQINGNIARAFAAYNGGPSGKTSKNMKAGMVGAAETDAYVTTIYDMQEELRLARESGKIKKNLLAVEQRK